MMDRNTFLGSVLKTTFFVVMIVLFWFIGVHPPQKSISVKQGNQPLSPVIILANNANRKGIVKKQSFKIPLGSQENQIGFMPYQEKVPPGFAQGGLPTEFYRDADGIIWVGDPFGPRLTAWSESGVYLQSIDLPFLRNESSTHEKEIVGYTVQPNSNGDWTILNNQNKKVYRVNREGELTNILSVPLALSDQRIVINISPFFAWVNEEWIFVTVETTRQPYTTKRGFAGGEYIDTKWESFFITWNGEIIGPVAEQASILPMKQGFILWSYHDQSLYMDWFSDPTHLSRPEKSWRVDGLEWHYGGLIGADQLDRIYFWADQGLIGRIHLRWEEVSYGSLPEQNIFPLTVSSEGDIGYIQAGKQSLQVVFTKMMD